MSTTDFERLERLEQAITLCLQEIDHNFIRCHRVATACLPVIERYAEQSRNVWEGAKFWKGFFEAAAEVSVSGYEELAEPTDAGDITGASLYSAQHGTPNGHRRTKSNEENAHGPGDLTVESLTLADVSTLRARHHKTKSREFETPYEKVQYQIRQQYRMDSSDVSISHPTVLDRYSAAESAESDSGNSPSSSFLPPSPSSTPRANIPFIIPPSTVKNKTVSPSKRQGPLLHRVLDSNWRLQATPLSKGNIYAGVDALSSPPAPEITTQIFSPSPMAKLLKTPLAQRNAAFEDSDSDFEDQLGMSPPVTMQFSMPASKLMKTPARTAAMNIVEEVLRTAGAKDTTLESIRTPRRRNVSDMEMWNAVRSAGTDNTSRMRVDVDLDGSPFVKKSGDITGMIGGVADKSITLTMGRHGRNGSDEYHTAQSLGDWQESDEWI